MTNEFASCVDFVFSTVMSPAAINGLSSSASLCLRTRTVIINLIGGTAVRFGSALCTANSFLILRMLLQYRQSLALPEDAT